MLAILRIFAFILALAAAAAQGAANYQGLWYRGEVERGWGMNIAHQDDILFVTWFTYDIDGSQMWLVGSDVRLVTGTTYTGTIYRTTGPAFDSMPFDPTRVNVSPVGSMTLTFADASTGTMTYVVNGVSQTKPIVRQVFASPVPDCVPDGPPPADPNFQDLWYASPAESERGWGLGIAHQGNILFVTWFTYDAAGRGMWIVGPRFEGATSFSFSGTLYRTTGPAFNAAPWDPSSVVVTPVGAGTLTFTSTSLGTFTYTVDGLTQSKLITPQVYARPRTVCR